MICRVTVPAVKELAAVEVLSCDPIYIDYLSFVFPHLAVYLKYLIAWLPPADEMRYTALSPGILPGWSA